MIRKVLTVLFAGMIVSCSDNDSLFRIVPSGRTGVEFNNLINESDSFHVMSYEYIYNGAGVGVGDFNNDGLPDLIFAGNLVAPKAYLNEGKFRFRDISGNFEGLESGQWFSGVAIADINGDGLQDVYITATRYADSSLCRNRLWINEGLNKDGLPYFSEKAEEYGIAHEGQSVQSGFFDYDRDGDLDLYVLNNTLTQRMNTQYREKITDGTAGNNDRLFRNNGDGTFTDVTLEAGIRFEGFGLGLAFGDVNRDGYPDIYVSNDYISNDLLYINQRDGTFKNEIAEYMSYQTKSSMGNDMADVNNDGFPDMYTMDMLPEKYAGQRQTINGFSYQYFVNDYKYGFEHQFLRNMLHINNGLMNGELLPFSEVGQMAGVSKSEWSWSPLFADYDNDGDKDLLIANGYPRDMTDKDWTNFQAKVFGSLATAEQVIDSAPHIKVPNMAFENDGALHFHKKNWLPEIPSYSYGAAFADLDMDGDLDYVVNNIDDEAFVMRNYTVEKGGKKANFLRLKLEGTEGNTMALGAKVEIWHNGNYQYVENFLTRGYASSVDPFIHFGLASDEIADTVKVSWPSGNKMSLLTDVEANSTIVINESEATLSQTFTLSKDELLFRRADSLIEYSHVQEDYIDFFLNQNIIPHKFSQIGPRIAKGDLDGDGTTDLIIGSTNKLPTAVFRGNGKNFVQASFSGLTDQKRFSEADLCIVDFDNDGDNDVLAVAGGYEQPENEYQHCLYENRDGSFFKIVLPVPPFPASVIRPFDYDHDGSMDFFIGARVKKDMYPYANHSWILKYDKGNFYTDAECKLDLGMVTDAVWSDYDNDGWEDLIVTRDWNSIVVVKNNGGKELVAQTHPDLEEWHGKWYSIAAGDFDNDGDDDYIAGNLGINTRFSISGQTPLNLYAIDLDMDGTIDPLSTAYWEDPEGRLTEYPINYLDELWAQSTFFKARFRTYKSFSYAGVNDFLNESVLRQLQFKLYINTPHSFVIWNDAGKFRMEELPEALQVSPIKKMVVRDFNRDGLTDVIIGGNDHTYDISTGYYDANKGFVLLGRGQEQKFDVLTPSQSGILLDGMVESLECIDGDTLTIVVGINRKEIVVYKNP